MDAARLNLKKTSLFFALALGLLTPALSHAQTLAASTTSVTLGNASCNGSYDLILSSSTGAVIPFTVKAQYNGATPTTGDQYGNWVYARTFDAAGNATGATSTGTSINGTTFATSVTNTTGATKVRVGLNIGLGGNTSDAYIVIHPTNGGADINIHVFYTPNIGCGANTGTATNGYVTITPGNLALTASLTGSQNLTLTLANMSATPLTFTSSAQGASWLSITVPSINIPGNGSATVVVNGNGAAVSAAGAYNGSVLITTYNGGTQVGTALNIQVVLTVTSTGGGTGSTGTLTLAGATSNVYNATPLIYIAPNVPGAICVPIQDSAPGANAYSYNVTTASGGDWLRANYKISDVTQGSLAASANACVTVSVSNTVSSVPTGAYTGTINLTSSSGSTAQINVTLYDISAPAAPGITITPLQSYQFGNVASGSTSLQQQSFTITAASGYTLGTAVAPSSPGWFSMTSPTFGANTESFTVTANPTGLANGIYTAVITVGSGGTASGTTTILVVLPVGQPGATTGGTPTGVTTVAPTTLSFLEQAGNNFWTGGQLTQNVSLVGPLSTQWTASIVYGAGATNWLTLKTPCAGNTCTGTFGSTPSVLPVDLFNVGTLAASATPYTATINISSATGTTSIGVTLLVQPSGTPVLFGLPSSRTFSATTGTAPAPQNVQVVGSDNTSSPTSPTITAGAPTVSWATATTNGNLMNITVNPAGQSTGTYAGTIPVRASGYTDTLNYPVVLIVNGGGNGTPTGPLTLSTTSLVYPNVTTSSSQTLNITASGAATNFTASSSEQSCTNANWLGIAPGGLLTATSSNTPIVVTVNPLGIPSGSTCLGTVTLATSAATQNVTISMTTGSSSTGPDITLTPTNLSYAYTLNTSLPASQTVSVANAISGTAAVPFNIASAVTGGVSNWLSAATSSGTTPYTATITINSSAASLTAGTYNGTVTFSPTTGGAAKVVNVTLTVGAAPTVSATPTTVPLTYIVGGTVPTANVQVSAAGATANFTATASSTNNWLKVSPGSGTTPNTGTYPLTVSIDPTVSLNPGPYTGTVTIAGVAPAVGTTIVTVNLTVTAPLPTITGVTNAASGATGAVSPGEIISLWADASHPIGPAASVKLDSTTCPNPCTQVPFTMGGVTVTFLPLGRQAPILFASAGQVNAVVPYDVAGIANLSVQVKYLGQTSNAAPLTSATTAPGVFTSNYGTGPAAVNMYDATGAYKGVNGVGNPAQRGWILAIYLTGEGTVTPKPADGSVITVSTGTPATPQPLYAPTVLIDSNPATVTGYGEVAGLVNGVLQVNAVVPAGVRSGPVTLSVGLGANSSQANVTVAIQ